MHEPRASDPDPKGVRVKENYPSYRHDCTYIDALQRLSDAHYLIAKGSTWLPTRPAHATVMINTTTYSAALC
jgi:hypothetical protein